MGLYLILQLTNFQSNSESHQLLSTLTLYECDIEVSLRMINCSHKKKTIIFMSENSVKKTISWKTFLHILENDPTLFYLSYSLLIRMLEANRTFYKSNQNMKSKKF